MPARYVAWVMSTEEAARKVCHRYPPLAESPAQAAPAGSWMRNEVVPVDGIIVATPSAGLFGASAADTRPMGMAAASDTTVSSAAANFFDQ